MSRGDLCGFVRRVGAYTGRRQDSRQPPAPPCAGKARRPRAWPPRRLDGDAPPLPCPCRRPPSALTLTLSTGPVPPRTLYILFEGLLVILFITVVRVCSPLFWSSEEREVTRNIRDPLARSTAVPTNEAVGGLGGWPGPPFRALPAPPPPPRAICWLCLHGAWRKRAPAKAARAPRLFSLRLPPAAAPRKQRHGQQCPCVLARGANDHAGGGLIRLGIITVAYFWHRPPPPLLDAAHRRRAPRFPPPRCFLSVVRGGRGQSG